MTQTPAEAVRRLAPWFHNLHLPDGTQTAPGHHLGDFPRFKWRQIEKFLPANLKGYRALDIGCNAGFYSFELARRGAKVVAIDADSHYLRQARWACRQFRMEEAIEFRRMQVYDLARSREKFDLVLFMGVFYHLRYPTLALDIVTQKCDGLMVFQSLTMPGHRIYPQPKDQHLDNRDVLLKNGWPKMAFVEHKFAGDPTNWWIPNAACVEALLRYAGFKVTGRPAHEIYVCKPLKKRRLSGATSGEYRSIITAPRGLGRRKFAPRGNT
jgi:tRNA (mo5U34)-methyltransferase